MNEITCTECGQKKITKPTKTGELRVPKGWHRHNGIFCGDCWRKKYILRAVTFPMVGPIDRTWQEFRDAISAAWANTTALSNWMLTELYVRDVRRMPGMDKLPKMPQSYLYPEARARFPDLPSQTVAALEQAVKGKYCAKRYKVLWTCEESLPNYRYPTPFSVPNQGWSASFDPSERPVVSVRIGEARWSLLLRGGWRMKRQLSAFRQIAGGEAVQGELAIYRQRAGESATDGGINGRGNGQRVRFDVMVKLVAWLPRLPIGERHGDIFVRTDKDSLLVAVNAKDEKVWVLNADHVRRWIAEHRRNLNRWSDDTKAEQRPVPSFADRRSAAVSKHRNRMQTFIKEAAAQVAAYARRCKVAEVVYDDSVHGFAPQFPWFMLRNTIDTKLDEYGIVMIASGDVAEENLEPLAIGEDDE